MEIRKFNFISGLLRTFWVINFAFIFGYGAFGQFYENGQDPFSIKWHQIKTEHFQVIFPGEVDSLGMMYAGYLDKIYQTGGLTLNHNPHRIPVVVHTRNVLSNGEVAWAPKRMNLYTIAPQIGNIEPYENGLALHEFRHVVQIDKINQSSSKFLYYLLGEQAIGAIVGWHIPLWFFEGDAVAYETGASNSGRGRQPDFAMKLKAQVAEKGIYSYPKAQFGSYRDFVPNHYELGYQLITLADQTYSNQLWSNTLDRVAKSPIHPNAFSKGIKENTGLPERKLYLSLMKQFASDNDEKNKVAQDSLNENALHDYLNYYSPVHALNGMIAYKTSYSDVSRIVFIDKAGKETELFSPGYIFDNSLSGNDSLLVWNEFKGTRWENRNYLRIVRFNPETKELKYLTRDTKVFQSKLSPDNSKILSVEVDNKLHWAITIRSSANGVLLDTINFSHEQPVQPSWSPDMKEIVFMTVCIKGISLGIMKLSTRKIKWLIKDEFLDLNYPIYTGKAVIVKGVSNNVSNYLKYDLDNQHWYRLTNSIYGVGEASVHNNALTYTDYTSGGFRIRTEEIDSSKSTVIDMPERYETKQTELLAKNETLVDLDHVDSGYTISKYHRIAHLVNPHSWAPIGINLQNYELGSGVTVMSQNALSTSTLSGGYQHILADSSHRYFVKYSYKGFYPIFDVNFSKIYHADSIPDSKNDIYYIKYSEVSFVGSMTIPFNLDRGRWNRKIQPQFVYEYMGRKASPENKAKINEPKIHSISGVLYIYNLENRSYRDLQPRWGQVFNLSYMCSPFDFQQMGELASAETWIYFPGVIKNHGIKLYGGYQWKRNGNYTYTDKLLYPAGYAYQDNITMLSFQANYTLPLWYPDLNIFEYIYIKRLKANGFYQYAGFENTTKHTDLSSAGADLKADMHLFRFVFPFEMGLRYARRINAHSNYFQFLFSVNF